MAPALTGPGGRLVRVVVLVVMFCLSHNGFGQQAEARMAFTTDETMARQVGAVTRGGAVPFGKIYRVTTLKDRGPGSLRFAVRRTGPRIIVFEVAGIINLKSDLKIFSPFLTIAGQTAPDPGITLAGGTLRIRTSDVIVQHIAVRPGPSNVPRISARRDAISISQCSKCRIPPQGILIDNVSASWSSDELIGMNGRNLRQITIRSSILAEALRKSGHPKGNHTAGMLIGGAVRGVEVVGNLFANNGFRNPAVNAGGAAVIANNFIYNPHNRAIHVNAGPKSNRKTLVSIIGNVMEIGPDTRANVPIVALAKDIAVRTPDTAVYVLRNRAAKFGFKDLYNPSKLKMRIRPPVVTRNWKLLPTNQTRGWALRYAGSRPARRNKVDRRIIDGVMKKSGRIIDWPKEVGGLKAVTPVRKRVRVPNFPFSRSKIAGKLRIENWLCQRHFDVGGGKNSQCSSTKR